MHRFAIPGVVLAAALLLTACQKDSGDGGRPIPVGGDSGTATSGTPSTSASEPSTEPSQPATTAEPTAQPKSQVIIKAGNFASNPAVQGLVSTYPLYFQALVTKDDSILKKKFPSFF